MSFLSGLFKKKPGGTFFGNLIRGVSKNIPIIGGSVGNGANKIEVGQTQTNAQLAGLKTAAYNSAVGSGGNPIAEKMAAEAATPAAIAANAGFPEQSQVFPNGANATQLNDVTVSANRMQSSPINTDFSLDWKNGKISSSSNSGTDNKMLLYGLLGLGAIMVLNKK